MNPRAAMKKARSKAWSPAARRKRAATIAAKRAGLGIKTADGWEGDSSKPVRRGGRRKSSPVNDAIIYLKHMERAIHAEVRAGRKVLATKAEMFGLLALHALTGVTE